MRLIDADRLIDDLKHDVAMDQDSLDYEELTDSNREKIQFDKDCKQNAIDLLQNAPTIEPEIVMCKDCRKHNVSSGYKKDCCALYEWRGISYGHEHDYQYCCFAERRNE